MKNYEIGKVLIGKNYPPIDVLIVAAKTKQIAIQFWQTQNGPLSHLWTISVKELPCKDTV